MGVVDKRAILEAAFLNTPPERVVAGTKETEQIGPASPAAAGYASHSPSLLTADNLPLRALEVAPYRSASVHSRH